MKKVLLMVLALYTFNASAQDSLKIRQIDSLVRVINESGFKVQTDSIIQNFPEKGIYSRTYILMIMVGDELKKYVNLVYNTTILNGVSTQMNGSNTFYYDKNQLIKVEELMETSEKKMTADWYYADHKPLYYTYQSPKSEERANFLITLSDEMMKQYNK